MTRPVFATLAAVALCACAPTLTFNQSFLVPEELKIAPNGYASLKSTGESLDLGPIKAQEKSATTAEPQLLKVHGNYVLVGDGWQHAWRLWPAGRDQVHFKPLSINPGKRGFASPSLESSTNCALIKWQRDGMPAQVFVNADGDANEKVCP